MKKVYLYICIIIVVLVSCTENTTIETINDTNSQIENIVIDKNNIPEAIVGITEGITVSHDPDSIYAEVYYRDTSRYVWKHSTVIKTDIDSLKIIDFGTYNFKDGEWILGNRTNKPYTTEDFDKWYFVKNEDGIVSWENCKDGIMQPNVEYIDPSNWSIINQELVSRHGLWYYIGIDPAGNKYMGYGVYVILPKLKPH